MRDPQSRSLGLYVVLSIVLVVTLWAGLHPFSWARENDVRWLGAQDGLRFGPASMVLTETELHWDTTSGPAALAVELWLVPAGETSEASPVVVLGDEPRMPALLLSQSGVDLIVASRVTNPDGERWYNDFTFPGVFVGDDVRHVALTSGTPRPRLYVGGEEVRATTGYGIPLARKGMPLQGRILVGCSPRASGSWRGDLRGLVLYERAPSRSEFAQRSGTPARIVAGTAGHPGVVAAYAFSEGKGDVVRDLSGKGPALRLPQYYRPIGATFLAFPSTASLTEPHALADVVVNLFGFMPLGFLLAHVLLRRRSDRPLVAVLLVIAAGAGISFAIESIQVLMPSRDSSLLDFLLNASGTAIGAGFALWIIARRGASSRVTDPSP